MWIWELDYKESCTPKNWCFWTAVLEKPLESPLDCKEIQPVNLRGDQSWIFTGKTEGRKRKGQQRMRWLVASPTQWTWAWVSSGSWWWTGSLAGCSPWGHKESDMTEWLNWSVLWNNTTLVYLSWVSSLASQSSPFVISWFCDFYELQLHFPQLLGFIWPILICVCP